MNANSVTRPSHHLPPDAATSTSTTPGDATVAKANFVATETADASSTAPSGLPGYPRTRSDCDSLSMQLTATTNRLREQVQAGMRPETYAIARLCLDGLEAAQSLVVSLRLTVGPDTAHAPIAPKR